MPHHRERHPTFTEGCLPCKLLTVGVATVPGGAKDARTGISKLNEREDDLHRYREKRRAGEQPDSTTRKGMEATEKRTALYEKRERDLRDHNPPEKVAQIKKSLTNTTE